MWPDRGSPRGSGCMATFAVLLRPDPCLYIFKSALKLFSSTYVPRASEALQKPALGKKGAHESREIDAHLYWRPPRASAWPREGQGPGDQQRKPFFSWPDWDWGRKSGCRPNQPGMITQTAVNLLWNTTILLFHPIRTGGSDYSLKVLNDASKTKQDVTVADRRTRAAQGRGFIKYMLNRV